jgi:hypothetical protein
MLLLHAPMEMTAYLIRPVSPLLQDTLRHGKGCNNQL